MKHLIPCFAFVLFTLNCVCASETALLKGLNGTWNKSSGEHDIEFFFKESTLLITLKRGGEKLVLECDVAASRDGRIFGTVSNIKEGGIQGASERGDLFGFKVQLKGELLELHDLRGTNVNEGAKNLVEGVFKKK